MISLITAIAGLAAALVAVFGIIFTARQFKAQRQDRKEDQEAVQAERKAARDAVLSDRFARAIGSLASDSPTTRIGALLEFDSLGNEMPGGNAKAMLILVPFIREGIEKSTSISKTHSSLKRPSEDVRFACAVASSLYIQRPQKYDLKHLNAKNLDLSDFEFQGADLTCAHFEGSCLSNTEFRNANLYLATFFDSDHKAILSSAKFKGAENLHGSQILNAYQVEYAELDNNVRAEYEHLKDDAAKKL